MGNIKRLPDSVHSIVRSSVILFDLPRVVEELIYNSIDAGSSKVDVSVNVRACSVKVTDDGCGITRDGLVLLGEKYVTSKHYPVDDFECGTSNLGFKGETLGSLSDISLVEIRTKARGWPNSYCKIIKGSKCIYMGIDDKREAVGTTVTVRELFYNQPVRRRCMQSSPKRELHSVKKCVLRIALVHPQTSFRVYDIESEDELLCTVPSSSPLPLISDGFGKDVSSSLHEIFHSDQLLTLSGFISGPCDAFSTRDLQYLYINSRFVRKNSIHNLINNLATQWQSCSDPNRDEPKAQSRKRPKHVAYPAFLLNLYCPLSSYDLNYEPSKTVVEFKDLNVVLAFVEKAVMNYWKVMPQHQLEETHLEDTSLSLEREILNEEKQKPLMVGRRKKAKVACSKISPPKSILKATDPGSSKQRKMKAEVTSYKSTPIQNVPEATNHNGLYETPRNLRASSLDLNPCTSGASHSYWSKCDPLLHLEDEYVPITTPMFGANYKTTDPVLKGKHSYSFQNLKEDESFLRACSMPSRESSYCMENENPRKACTSHYMEFENSSEDFSNPDTCYYTDRMLHHESGNCSTSVWDSPGASVSDFGSPQKDCFLDSPFWSGTRSYQNKWCRKQRRLMEDQGQFFESARDIFCESPVLSFKKALWDHDFSSKRSQFFDFPVDQTPFSPLLDSPIIAKKSYISLNEKDFPCLDSPITKKSDWANVLDGTMEEQTVRCYPSARHCKVTFRSRRSCSAPPFYKGKCKYSYLNDQLITLMGEGSTSQFSKTTIEAEAPVHSTTPEMHSSQPCLDPAWSETLELNLREKEKKETSHTSPACQHDNFEPTGNDLTKWRANPIQPPVVSLSHSSTDDVLNISSGLLHLSSTSLIPESIDRDCLEDAKVLLQLDKKFIPVIASDTLVILDQHAADERIRLEDLRRKVLSGEGCESAFLNSEEELVLPEMGFQLLEKYGEQIKKWGWLTSIDNHSSDPFKKSMNLLKRHEGHNSVISLVAVPCILGTNLTSKDLLEFLEQLVETDGSGNLPPAVVRILNLKACRGAIMFGDPLLPSECSLILEELKATSLCFQCAHGRPTTVPLLNIKRLHVELEKIKMQNMGSDDKWHGLTHHKLSVEYAQQRLNCAKM